MKFNHILMVILLTLSSQNQAKAAEHMCDYIFAPDQAFLTSSTQTYEQLIRHFEIGDGRDLLRQIMLVADTPRDVFHNDFQNLYEIRTHFRLDGFSKSLPRSVKDAASARESANAITAYIYGFRPLIEKLNYVNDLFNMLSKKSTPPTKDELNFALQQIMLTHSLTKQISPAGLRNLAQSIQTYDVRLGQQIQNKIDIYDRQLMIFEKIKENIFQLVSGHNE